MRMEWFWQPKAPGFAGLDFGLEVAIGLINTLSFAVVIRVLHLLRWAARMESDVAQLRILLRRQLQPDSATLASEGLLDLLPAGYVQRKVAALRHLPDLLVVLKHDLAWQ